MYEFCDATSIKDKVVYSGDSATPVVTVNYENTLTGETYQATIGKTKGQNLTAEELLAAIDKKHGTALKNAYAEKKLTLVSVKNFRAGLRSFGYPRNKRISRRSLQLFRRLRIRRNG